MKIVPYEVVKGPNDDARVKAEGTTRRRRSRR